jgi:peptidoglycan/xylan/chitin deacetylase (PgdA/CDA1 family)
VPTAFLMYHELERPGRAVSDLDPGYIRYVVREATFSRQLAWLAEQGLRGVSAGAARAAGLDAPSQVVLTFDDGAETDWVVAAPLLAERGFGATFYVVSRWVDRRHGFMSVRQVRELVDAGFEVGSHSATHALLTQLDESAMRFEIADSKRELEDILGAPVRHFSCPGGRWSQRIAHVAREAGYETVATSRVGLNDPASDPYALMRCAVRRLDAARTFEAFCRGTRIGPMQARERVLTAAKSVLGHRLYAALRGMTLTHTE